MGAGRAAHGHWVPPGVPGTHPPTCCGLRRWLKEGASDKDFYLDMSSLPQVELKMMK